MFKRLNTQPNSIESPGFESESSIRPKAANTRSIRSRFAVYRDESNDSRVESDAVEHTSSLVVAFVNTLNATQLSNFLIWFFYHDLVVLPESPALWFRTINSTEMRGWIALGKHLSKTTTYSLELVVLFSICDRLHLSGTLIRECLVRLADPSTMASTLLSTIIQKASIPAHSEIDVLEIVKYELRKVSRLLSRLKPSAESIYSELQPKIAKQLKDFVDVVVACRIASLRKSSPPFSLGLPPNKNGS
jgi:hypothetical protein